MITRFMNWWNGWRQDYEGWWTRARRQQDEMVLGPNPVRGFLEEASVSVMTPEDARNLDRWIRPVDWQIEKIKLEARE